MAQVTPILGGVTLANPDAKDGYSESYGYRGVDTEMADGSLSTDLVSTTAKRTFVLKWTALTDMQKVTLASAFATVKDATTGVAFTAPTNSAYTVTRAQDFLAVDFEAYLIAGGALRWRAELQLREV